MFGMVWKSLSILARNEPVMVEECKERPLSADIVVGSVGYENIMAYRRLIGHM
jgi:hypothetical protein